MTTSDYQRGSFLNFRSYVFIRALDEVLQGVPWKDLKNKPPFGTPAFETVLPLAMVLESISGVNEVHEPLLGNAAERFLMSVVSEKTKNQGGRPIRYVNVENGHATALTRIPFELPGLTVELDAGQLELFEKLGKLVKEGVFASGRVTKWSKLRDRLHTALDDPFFDEVERHVYEHYTLKGLEGA